MLPFHEMLISSDNDDASTRIELPTKSEILIAFNKVPKSNWAVFYIYERQGVCDFSVYWGVGDGFLVEVNGHLLIDNDVPVPSDPEDYEYVCIADGEVLRQNLVSDFGKVSMVVEHYVETGECLTGIEPFRWINPHEHASPRTP